MKINEWDLCPTKYSKCEICKYYFKNERRCWFKNYIPVMIWNGSDHPLHKCQHFKSIISNQNNSHYIFHDYEDGDRFPEKKFGGQWKFDKSGNRIGKQ